MNENPNSKFYFPRDRIPKIDLCCCLKRANILENELSKHLLNFDSMSRVTRACCIEACHLISDMAILSSIRNKIIKRFFLQGMEKRKKN